MRQPRVALVAFGTESTDKIARVLNTLKVIFEVVPSDTSPRYPYTHIILSGGPDHVYDIGHRAMPKWILDSKAPVLGICYGMQLIAHTFGGIIRRMKELQHGPVMVSEFLNNSQRYHKRWMNRWDQVVMVPKPFVVIGKTGDGHIASITDSIRWWGVQYHPEAEQYGDLNIFRTFLGI